MFAGGARAVFLGVCWQGASSPGCGQVRSARPASHTDRVAHGGADRAAYTAADVRADFKMKKMEVENPVQNPVQNDPEPKKERGSSITGLYLTEDGTLESMGEDLTELRWFHVVPVVNLIHDWIFDETPTPDQMKEILNIFALILALLFSIAVALPTAFDFEEVADAIARFSESPYLESTDGWSTFEKGGWGWWLWTSQQLTMASILLGSARELRNTTLHARVRAISPPLLLYCMLSVSG